MDKSEVLVVQGEVVDETTASSDSVPVLLTPKDQRDWDRVLMVREAFRAGNRTVTQACAHAGMTRQTFYASIANPLVQQMILAEMRGLDAIATEVLNSRWIEVIMNMAKVATSADSKEAVQAARFLRDVKRDIESDNAGSVSSGVSEARRIIDAVMGKPGKRLKLKQVTQTIEVDPD